MNKDYELTSQELEQTLELLREHPDALVMQQFSTDAFDVWELAYIMYLSVSVPLPLASSSHIRYDVSPLTVGNPFGLFDQNGLTLANENDGGVTVATYIVQDVLDYFQNLKRLRNLRALID